MIYKIAEDQHCSYNVRCIFGVTLNNFTKCLSTYKVLIYFNIIENKRIYIVIQILRQ